MKGGIRWYSDTLTPRAAGFMVAVVAGVDEILDQLAQQVQDYAQANAPWEDRTGAARDGLTAEHVSDGLFRDAIVLYHTVDYGIWLEVRWSGQYAIIIPTIEHMGPVVMGELEGLFGVMP